MKTCSKGGGPPEGHERQCNAKSRVSQSRCRRWALKERKYCQFHGGRRRDARRNGLPTKYGKYLGDTLKKAVDDFLSEPHHEQVSVYEELAISRLAASQAIKLAQPVLEGRIELSAETRALALGCLQDAMNNVRDMVVAAARIEAIATDKVSIRILDTFVTQIIRSIYRVCGDDDEMAAAIEVEIRKTVRLPSKESEGIDILPSTILEMDSTITGDGGAGDILRENETFEESGT